MFRPQIQKTWVVLLVAIFSIMMVYFALANITYYETVGFKDKIEDHFLNSLVSKMGIIIKDKTFTFILYILLFASWLYAYFRFMNQYKVKIIPNELTKYIVYFMIIGWVLVTLPSLKNI